MEKRSDGTWRGYGRRLLRRFHTAGAAFLQTSPTCNLRPLRLRCMPITSQHEAAERAMRELLEREGLPQPDEVEHRDTSILLLWHATKLAVVIDLEEGDEAPPP